MQGLGLRAVEKGSGVVLVQLVLVVWMSTVVDDQWDSFLWSQASQVGKTVVSDKDVQVVLGLVDVGGEWHDTGDTGRVCLGLTSGRGVHY